VIAPPQKPAAARGGQQAARVVRPYRLFPFVALLQP